MTSLDRRQFTMLPLLAAPLLATRSIARPKLRAAQFPPPPRPEKLELAARVTPEGAEVDLTERLAALRAAGFDGVEVAWPGTFRADRVRRAADAAGCPIHSVRVGESFGAALSLEDADARALGERRLADALRLAGELGAKSISIVPGAITPTVSEARAWNLVKISLRSALPLAEELGVRIALRLGGGDFLSSPLEAARFLDELGSPLVGWQLDTAWSLVRSYPQHWAHILGARLIKVDLGDYSRAAAASGGVAAGFAVDLGSGDLDGPTTLEALAHALYSGWVTVDVEERSPETFEARAKRARVLLELERGA
jgi:hexulose-6-phosphate isomerase